MLAGSSIAATVCKAALIGAALVVTAGAATGEESKYPDLRGQWLGVLRAVQGLPGQPSFDPAKAWGKGQGAPLTPEYEKVLEANLQAQENGSFGEWRGSFCLGFGMPLIAYGFQPMEVVVTPETTYLQIGWVEHVRRVYTDGRDWPAPDDIPATLTGYSIGRWVDSSNSGHYDTLEVETRGPFKGPRHYDAAGLPLHHDEQSIFKERFYLDKANKNLLHDEITTIDHALTRPWTVTRDFRRNPSPRPKWDEFVCAEGNVYVEIEHEGYYLSAGGLLMPMRKGQKPPNLKYFK